jgi:acetyl esterase/lipase
MPYVLRCAAACKARQIVFLEYSLSPEYPYPCQLVQAVAALRYLLKDEAISPSDLIIGGDSAGGQLTASLLMHLAKPSPYAAPIDLNGVQLRAALFVSPWAVMHTDQPSFSSNDGKDFLDRQLALMYLAFWNPDLADVWANFCEAKDARELWTRVFPGNSQGMVKKALVTVGTAEVLLDACRTFAEEAVRAETVVVDQGTDLCVLGRMDFVMAECVGEVHVQAALDCLLSYHEGKMMNAITAFLEHV